MEDDTRRASYHAFLKSHKMVQKGHGGNLRSFQTDSIDEPDEEEIQLHLKFLWTVAFSLSAESSTASLSSSILEKIVHLANDLLLSLPVSFWRRVCPHCLSFYHVSGCTIISSCDEIFPKNNRIMEMDKIIAQDAPNSLSAILLGKRGPSIVYICETCAGGARWMLPLK